MAGRLRAGNDLALREWAVTCDALARGEQILLLREADLLGSRDDLDRHREFWLYPTWDDQRIADVTDPYRDRLRRLRRLHRDDGRLRLRYYATVEYLERIGRLDRLLALDGEHTLNAAAVERRFGRRGRGLWLLLVRIHESARTTVLEETPACRAADAWTRLGTEAPTDGARPVVDEARFLAEKARLVQRSGSIQAV